MADEDIISKKDWYETEADSSQHKLANETQRLTEKYAAKGKDFTKTEQYRSMQNYLDGVPDSRGGNLGTVTDNDRSFSSGDVKGDQYRKEFYEGAGGKGSNYLKGINTVLARQGLSGDDYFNYRQQLYSQDPEAYKKAFPGSSGQLLQKLVQVATPGLNWINAIKNGITNTSQAKNFTNEDVVESVQPDDNQEEMIDTSIVDIKQTNKNKTEKLNLAALQNKTPTSLDIQGVQNYISDVSKGIQVAAPPENLKETWDFMVTNNMPNTSEYLVGNDIINQSSINPNAVINNGSTINSITPINPNPTLTAVMPANPNFNFTTPQLNYDLINQKQALPLENATYPGVL